MSRLPWQVDPMPALSADLLGDARPDACQACGATEDLSRWLEHDEADAPTDVVVVLCRRCSDESIESHVRLYRRMDAYEPLPGSMPVCVDCVFRRGTGCVNPLLRKYGGPGLPIRLPKPSVAFIDFRGADGRLSGHADPIYHAPPVCTERRRAS